MIVSVAKAAHLAALQTWLRALLLARSCTRHNHTLIKGRFWVKHTPNCPTQCWLAPSVNQLQLQYRRSIGCQSRSLVLGNSWKVLPSLSSQNGSLDQLQFIQKRTPSKFQAHICLPSTPQHQTIVSLQFLQCSTSTTRTQRMPRSTRVCWYLNDRQPMK